MNDLEKLFHDTQPTTLTFDCYGTLVDWEAGATTALRDIYGYSTELVSENALIDMFLGLDAIEIRKNTFPYSDVLKNVADKIAKRLLGNATPELSDAFLMSLPTWPVFAETNEALKQLAKHFRLAIISNVDDELLFETLQSFDLVFDEVVTSQQSQCYKPDAMIFEQAICRLHEIPAKIIHVAEGLCEARPAKKLGMQSIWVKRSDRSDDGSGATPNATAHNLVELVDAAERTFAS